MNRFRLTNILLLTGCACPNPAPERAQADDQPSLVGVWGMRDVDGSWLRVAIEQDSIDFASAPDSLSFATGGRQGINGQYRLVEAPNSTQRVYLRVGDEFHPFALARVADERLTLCLVDAYERTLGGIPVGGITRTEWPRSVDEPTCNVLRKQPSLDEIMTRGVPRRKN